MQNLTIGERINLLRENLKKKDKKRYSLQSVASRIGLVTKQSLSLIERGKIKNPSSVLLNKLGADFGVTVDFLLTGIGGHKEKFLEKKKLLNNNLAVCREAMATGRTECSPASLYLYEKTSNLLDLFDVVVGCLEREVMENYDRYNDGIEKLISFLEYLASIIPLLNQKHGLEDFINRAFWGLGKVVREIAVQIDRDGNLRNFYPEELQEIVKTAIMAMSTVGNRELPALPQALEVIVKDFHLKITYRRLADIPDEYLDEFKKRVIFEWEMMLNRIREQEIRNMEVNMLQPNLSLNRPIVVK